jgi:nitrogen fixation/metabolism regulation signal transduction histidine kinase
MLAQVHASAATVMVNQQRAIWITDIVTAVAAILGLLFAGLVGAGITRPVRLLLQGARDVEAGQLDRSIDVVTRDEIGQLTAAFNRMVDQLRVVGGADRIARALFRWARRISGAPLGRSHERLEGGASAGAR